MSDKHTAIFRRATHADIPAMSAIRLSVVENVLRDPSRVTPAMYEDYLEAAGRGWVAEIGGEVRAFSYADRHQGSIWALFVKPGYEGHGLAKQLLALATGWLFVLGHQSVTLTTTAGTRADRFYARQGWQARPLSASEVEYTLAHDGAAANRADLDAGGLIPHAV